jgi:hypothetical protein
MNQKASVGVFVRLSLRLCPVGFALMAFWLGVSTSATRAGEDVAVSISATQAVSISAAEAEGSVNSQLHSGNARPIAAWSFAGTEGSFVPDASGHGYDGVIYGQPVLVPRLRHYVGLAFDGSGDNSFWQGGAQNCGVGISKPLNQAFKQLSIEAWVRKDPAWWMPIVYRDKWDDPSGFGLYMEWSSGKAVFGHYGVGVQSESVVQDGQWHHVVGTLEPAAGCGYLYRIYVDGQLDADQVGLWAVEEAPAGSGILKIAYPNSSGADNPLKGAVDGIAIYDVALTPAQVKARFQATREPAQ